MDIEYHVYVRVGIEYHAGVSKCDHECVHERMWQGALVCACTGVAVCASE